MSGPRSRLLRGMSAALGVASGPAFVLERHHLRVSKVSLEPGQVEGEVARLREALERSHQQLEALREKLGGAHREPSLILEAQLLMLRDEQLTEEPARLVRQERINAEWALMKVVSQLRRLFADAEDDYLRERSADIDHVVDRVLRNLMGVVGQRMRPPAGVVVIAHELSPAEVVQLHRAGVVALATDVGGRTSHTALMARAFELPAVVGLRDVSEQVAAGQIVVVDGLAGEVVVDPAPDELARYRARASRFAATEEALHKDREKPAVTKDGYVVRLLANIELAEEVPQALHHGAEGVGLYRTEFLYMDREALPTEEEHAANARTVLEGMGDRSVTFRTFDLGGGEKATPLIALPEEDNPALGLRSIRLAFREEALFRAQLRGLLRASTAGRMKIMFPMVSSVLELRTAKRILEECRTQLLAEGHAVAEELQVGIMVEMPAAAMIADLLAAECDFFSIGSNDLIQYSLAIDRDNEAVNYLYHPLHPAILRLIRFVTRVAHAEGIRVSLCGEMAGDPAYAMVLLGLGLDELSMPAAAIPRIKRIVRACTVSESIALAEELVRLPTVRQIEDRVREVMCPRFIDDLQVPRSGSGVHALVCVSPEDAEEDADLEDAPGSGDGSGSGSGDEGEAPRP